MSYSTTASIYHDPLAEAMRPLRGRIVTPAEVRAAVVTAFPPLDDDQDWIKPSDHCSNHTNKGACQCTTTDEALFERLAHGKYRVL